TLPKNIIQFCIPICPAAHPFKRASYLHSFIVGSAVKAALLSDPEDVQSPSKSQTILGWQTGCWQDDESMITLFQAWATQTVVLGHEICDGVEEIRGTYYDYMLDVERFLYYCMGDHGEY
ncbi:hypothetical protein ACHAW6_015351, partial [Cyclotella cf. meneghiniana]